MGLACQKIMEREHKFARGAFLYLCVGACAALLSCKENTGNGEARPENSAKGSDPDQQRNNTPKSGTGQGGGGTQTPANPAAGQTPGQPASKTNTSAK